MTERVQEKVAIPQTTILEQVKGQLQRQGRKDLASNMEPYDIALGKNHTAIVTRSGELFTCGQNEHGQLGIKDPSFEVDQ